MTIWRLAALPRTAHDSEMMASALPNFNFRDAYEPEFPILQADLAVKTLNFMLDEALG